MKRTRLILATLAVPAVILVGCGQTVETAVETATGADIQMSGDDVTIAGEGGESMTIDSDGGTVTYTDEEEGLEITTGADQELPEGWPAGLPVPPGDTITAVSESADGTILVSWSWNGMSKQDLDAYLGALESAGYTEQSDPLEQDYGDAGFTKIVGFADSTNELTVSAQAMEGMGGISVSIQPVG